jgi:hypothetical protein
MSKIPLADLFVSDKSSDKIRISTIDSLFKDLERQADNSGRMVEIVGLIRQLKNTIYSLSSLGPVRFISKDDEEYTIGEEKYEEYLGHVTHLFPELKVDGEVQENTDGHWGDELFKKPTGFVSSENQFVKSDDVNDLVTVQTVKIVDVIARYRDPNPKSLDLELKNAIFQAVDLVQKLLNIDLLSHLKEARVNPWEYAKMGSQRYDVTDVVPASSLGESLLVLQPGIPLLVDNEEDLIALEAFSGQYEKIHSIVLGAGLMTGNVWSNNAERIAQRLICCMVDMPNLRRLKLPNEIFRHSLHKALFLSQDGRKVLQQITHFQGVCRLEEESQELGESLRASAITHLDVDSEVYERDLDNICNGRLESFSLNHKRRRGGGSDEHNPVSDEEIMRFVAKNVGLKTLRLQNSYILPETLKNILKSKPELENLDIRQGYGSYQFSYAHSFERPYAEYLGDMMSVLANYEGVLRLDRIALQADLGSLQGDLPASLEMIAQKYPDTQFVVHSHGGNPHDRNPFPDFPDNVRFSFDGVFLF